MARITTWREEIRVAMLPHAETLDDIVFNTMSEEQMGTQFDSGYGGTEGIPFTVWTAKRVYFPACYDGAEWVASVSRDPDGFSTDHVGGG